MPNVLRAIFMVVGVLLAALAAIGAINRTDVGSATSALAIAVASLAFLKASDFFKQ